MKNKHYNNFYFTILFFAIYQLVVSLQIFSTETNDFYSSKNYPQREFKIAISYGLPMLHPHISFNADEAQILTAFCEGLFVYDPYTLQAVPALAEKWKVTGGRTWRFYIRKNAKFENGDPITAQTIADSWFNLLTPNANYQYASLLDCIDGARDYRTGKLKNKNQVGIKVESENELLVYTTIPAEHLPNILCHHAFSAVHKSQWEDAKKFVKIAEFKSAEEAFMPIASGAYKIEKFTDDAITVVKNENYWDKDSVKIPKITMFLNLTKEEAAEKFNMGEVDWLSRADVISKIGEQRFIHIDPIFGTEFFFFKTSSAPVKNKKLRQALLLAIPYNQLRDGYYIKAKTLVFPLAGYPSLEGIDEFNIYKAKEIIKDLNLANEEKEIIIKVPQGEYYTNLIEIISKAWKEIGIQCKAVRFSFSEYYETLKASDYNLGIISWIGDFADPLAFLEMFRPASTLNDSNWNNKEFEQALQKAGAEKDISKRYAQLARAEEILLKDSIIIPLSHNNSVNILDLFALEGWFSNAIDVHPFKFIGFVKPQPLPGVVKK